MQCNQSTLHAILYFIMQCIQLNLHFQSSIMQPENVCLFITFFELFWTATTILRNVRFGSIMYDWYLIWQKVPRTSSILVIHSGHTLIYCVNVTPIWLYFTLSSYPVLSSRIYTCLCLWKMMIHRGSPCRLSFSVCQSTCQSQRYLWCYLSWKHQHHRPSDQGECTHHLCCPLAISL